MKKIITVLICTMIGFGITGCGKSISKIIIDDLQMNVDETKEISIELEPEGMDVEDVSCKISDNSIAKLDGLKVTGLKEGSTTYTCTSGKIESKANVVITMTEEQKKAKEQSDKIAKEKADAKAAEDAAKKAAAEKMANATIGQKNALSKAKDYLNYSAFSYSGLIEQLEFEGFSNEDATFAVDNCGADWNKQASQKAQDYLDFSSFSRQGLIDQLIFEGYTYEQAEYGVTQVGY